MKPVMVATVICDIQPGHVFRFAVFEESAEVASFYMRLTKDDSFGQFTRESRVYRVLPANLGLEAARSILRALKQVPFFERTEHTDQASLWVRDVIQAHEAALDQDTSNQRSPHEAH